MRQSGYYWVGDGYEWHVCFYDENTDMWTVCGSDGEFSDSDFLEIDERKIERVTIQQPEKGKCRHPEWGTDGGGDYCKKCGYRLY